MQQSLVVVADFCARSGFEFSIRSRTAESSFAYASNANTVTTKTPTGELSMEHCHDRFSGVCSQLSMQRVYRPFARTDAGLSLYPEVIRTASNLWTYDVLPSSLGFPVDLRVSCRSRARAVSRLFFVHTSMRKLFGRLLSRQDVMSRPQEMFHMSGSV